MYVHSTYVYIYTSIYVPLATAIYRIFQGGLAALPTPSFCPPAGALPIPSALSVSEQYAAEVALQQYVASGVERPTEESISPATPRQGLKLHINLISSVLLPNR